MTSDPTTWSDLKTRLADWVDRTDLSTTQIPEAIALAERKFNRTLFAPEREIQTTVALVASTETAAAPTDLWSILDFYLSTDPKAVLEPMPFPVLRNTYSQSATGKPQNYAIRGETFVFGPVPDGAYTGYLTYMQSIPALGGSLATTTNWLLTDHPDLYLAGSLAALHMLVKDEGRAKVYAQEAGDITEQINRSTIRRTQGGPPVRIRSSIVI